MASLLQSAASTCDLVLASASPRRRALLEQVGLRLRVVAANVDETPHADETALAYVQRVAAAKATAVMKEGGDVAILAADTTVVVDGRILGKPAARIEAAAMLRELSGRTHQVLTAYRIRFGGHDVGRVVTTDVVFRSVDEQEVAAYAACGEWDGKAGGYAIQGVAAAFVTAVHGSITNVIGLPLSEVIEDLRALGAIARYPEAGFHGEEQSR